VLVRLQPLQLKVFFDPKYTSYIYLYKKLIKQKKTKMRKLIAILAIATTLVACGGGETTNVVATDSTVVATDSTVKADSTVTPVADTTVVK
jgi:hypothetical protein